ncbi:hypothetical protein EDD21DRAFT_414672 [Dissophora ornata]|nr:hypothetical protein EDD21DRAFT_414672 [Dissophora ornata]
MNNMQPCPDSGKASLSPLAIPLILEEILSYLDPNSIKSCLRVCKHWHTLAAPIRWKREKQLAQAAAALRGALRPQTLVLSGQQDLEDAVNTLLPVTLQLRRLELRMCKHRGVEEDCIFVPMEAIFGHEGLRLRDLCVRNQVGLSINGIDLGTGLPLSCPSSAPPSPSPALRLAEWIPVDVGLELIALDVSYINLTARRMMDFAQFFPLMQRLQINIGPATLSIKHYGGCELMLMTWSEVFARDFSAAWPRLEYLGLRHEPYNLPSDCKESKLAMILSRDLIAALASRLKTLDLWTTLLCKEILGVMVEASVSEALPTSSSSIHHYRYPLGYQSPSASLNNRGLLQLEQLLAKNGFERRDEVYMSPQSLINFLRTCSTLQAIRVPHIPLNLKLFDDNPIFKCINGSSDCMSFWACQNLRHLELAIVHDLEVGDDNNGGSDLENKLFRLYHCFFKQMSLLTQLRVLTIRGLYFPCDLARSGFHQLAALSQLQSMSIGLRREQNSLIHASKETSSSSESIQGYVSRRDLEWMENSYATTGDDTAALKMKREKGSA